jgi:hypothetical protein
MQRDVNITREEEVFSMWFAYIHYWATDMGPPQDYTSSTTQNQITEREREREREWGESSTVKEEGFG